MKRLVKWFLMLTKRLYKKATFVVILALIPLSVLALGVVSSDESGFLHIVLAQTDPGDTLSQEITQSLLSDSSLIRFSLAATPEEAANNVRTGKADAAWIFADDMAQKISGFISGSNKEAAVTVIERETTISLRLSREKLSAELYKHSAREYYISFVRTNLEGLNDLTDEELLAYYDNIKLDEELFVFGSPNSDESAPETGYLLAPVRGFLSILVVLCGMAAAMFYMQDEKSGTFSWVPASKKWLVGLACLFIAVINVAVIMLVSLYAAGLATSFIKEVVNLIIYSVCCSLFCLVLKQMFNSIRLYGSLIPLIAVIMFAVCPVFFDFREIGWVQRIFPPTYYINAAYDDRYMVYMAVYTAVLAGLYLVGCKLIKK